MVKKRLVFALLWQKGSYCLSRNFTLQAAGDLTWIQRHYNFEVIAFSIDELVILNTSRGDKDLATFARDVAQVTRGCFAPLAAGGGIRSIEDARLLLGSGADKLVVNTPLFTDPALVRELARQFGSQCVVASIDYKTVDGRQRVVTTDGTTPVAMSVEQAVTHAEELGAGEIFLTSIDRDGTGQGYDLETLQRVVAKARVPLIASGGVGDFRHLSQWLLHERAQAAATANIFNFLGDGLPEARRQIEQAGVDLARWALDWRR